MIAVNAMTHVMLLVSKATTINDLGGTEGWKKPRKKTKALSYDKKSQRPFFRKQLFPPT